MPKKVVLIILCLCLVVAAGCTGEKAAVDNIMNDFQTLIEQDTSVEEVAGFINNNIASVSKEDATKMVDQFEKLQKEYLPQFEDTFTEKDIQEKINTESDIKDAELEELLVKTKNSGYKVETSEGFFFPIIDYEFYKKFSSYVTPDMKDYIDIMAEESNKVPAKDAAFMIGWDDVIKRAMNQEQFINNHKDSVKVNEVKKLYNNYVTFALYGLNNTPLFSYDSNTIDPAAREIYSSAVANLGNSDFLKTLSGFWDVLRNNNYKLTEEVKAYRDNVSKKTSIELSSSNSEQKDDTLATLLNQIALLAKQGNIINCEFPVETTVIDTVMKKWGAPDKEDYVSAAKGTYVTYSKYNVVFGFNKGSQVFDVRSYDNSLKQVTVSKVKEVLGTPEKIHHFNTEDMLVYRAGEKYQLLFIFPKATEKNSDPQLNHYNVFYPKGTVNMMADDPGIKY